MTNRFKANLNVPMFVQMIAPNGYLNKDKACHALWYYFSMAASNYKDEKEHIRYEGDFTQFNYHQLWKSVAELYGVDPSTMGNYWPAVDMQARLLGLTQLPREDKYRSPGSLYASIRPAKI